MTSQSDSLIGEYYARKAREARELYAELQQAIEDGRNQEEIDELTRKLESARYVGD